LLDLSKEKLHALRANSFYIIIYLIAINITIPLRILLGLEFFNREAIDGFCPGRSPGQKKSKVRGSLRESAVN
jgi:hypothetical protein